MPRQKLTSSREDYLEAILSLIHTKGFARVRDIAAQLGVGRSAVSNALTALARHGLVVYEPYHMVTLTDKGDQAARAVTQRHDTLKRFMEDVLGLTGEQADAAACSFEHNIDPAVLERIDRLTAFFSLERSGKSLTRRWQDFLAASQEDTDA